MIDFLQVISEEASECSYLEDQIATLPMCLPTQPINRNRFDQLMEAGYRRSGAFFYRTQCESCSACEPLRIDIARFQLSRSYRRVLQRAAELQIQIDEPVVDDRRVELFNLHRHGRHLARDDSDLDAKSYRSFLLCAPNLSVELSIWSGDTLLSIAITDIGGESASAVYCCFDPTYADLSLGTLSILKQVELAKTCKFKWLYLGLYVAANRHLSYKSKFKPHQRRVNGQWQTFE